MSLFEKIIFALQAEMKTPEAFGWFHLGCLFLMLASIAFLHSQRENYGERQLKIVLGTYGIVAFVLELAKQIVWAFNYDAATQIVSWDYQWYAAPFQLCTTPIYVSVACLLMKECSTRKAMLSYLSFTTILGSIATIFMPDSCFVETILVNVHTTWMHYGSFVVSVYLIMSGAVELSYKNLKGAIEMFLMFVGIATALNVGVYHSGALNGETFNMFYISPYFISSLPVFDAIQKNAPYLVFLMTYIVALSLGSILVFLLERGIEHLLSCDWSLKRRFAERLRIHR